MFLSENLRNSGGGTGKHCQTAWAALGALVGARSTEQAAQSIWAHRADHPGSRLAWTADWALGRIALEHLGHVRGALHWENAHTLDAGCVLATGLTVVLAHLAHHLGADRAGDINVPMSVLDVHSGTGRVLVVLDLGGVLDTLDGLDYVLA